jgi:5,10-methenyltetrahydromethanopterin hydrogenase
VLLGIRRGVLRVYVREDGPSVDEDAEDAAYELLTHAVGALRPSPATIAGPVSLLAAAAVAIDRWSDN